MAPGGQDTAAGVDLFGASGTDPATDLGHSSSFHGQAGRRFEEPESLSMAASAAEIRRGGYIPEEHVNDMDIDGIDVGVLDPTQGLMLYGVPDSELL